MEYSFCYHPPRFSRSRATGRMKFNDICRLNLLRLYRMTSNRGQTSYHLPWFSSRKILPSSKIPSHQMASRSTSLAIPEHSSISPLAITSLLHALNTLVRLVLNRRLARWDSLNWSNQLFRMSSILSSIMITDPLDRLYEIKIFGF